MHYVTSCPFRVGTVLWQARPGAWTLTTCVKITYALAHEGEATVADDQDPIAGPRTWGDDPRAAPSWPGDYAPLKRRVDVIVTGHAYAPTGRGAVDTLVARYRIGELGKALRVVGDRVWTPRGGALWPSAPSPFLSMPLRWERAARTLENPIGIDPTRPPAPGALALPNLELEGAEPGDARAAGLGPVAAEWPSRRALLAADAWSWAQSFRAGAEVREPVPRGFDFRFFNAAPADQQVDALRATATIVLEHLHPRHARLVTRLPPLRPRLAHEARGQRTEVGLRCDTLVIDADRGLAVVSWRGSIEVPSADVRDLGRLSLSAEQNGEPLRFPGYERGVVLEDGAPGPGLEVAPRPSLGSSPRFGPPPPPRPEEPRPPAPRFGAPPAPPAPPRPAPRPAPSERAPRPTWADRPRLDAPTLDPDESTIAIVRPAQDDEESTRAIAVDAVEGSAPTRTDLVTRVRDPLPFAATATPPPSSPPPSRGRARPPTTRADGAEGTHEIRLDAIGRSATPFADDPAPSRPLDGPASRPAPASTPPSVPPASSPGAPPRVGAPAAAPPPPAPAWDAPAPAAPAAEAPVPDLSAPPPPAIEPPPMIGPIQVAGPAPPPAPAPAPALEIVDDGRRDLGIDEYARVRARLAHDPDARAAILGAERLTEPSWREVDARWLAALAAETRRGRSKLLGVFDDAYVAEQEARRGPMTVAEYARLAAAIELGDVDPVLAELRLDRGDLMRLVRVWTRRTLGDPELAAELRAELDVARRAD